MCVVFLWHTCFNKLKKGKRYMEKKELDFVSNEKNICSAKKNNIITVTPAKIHLDAALFVDYYNFTVHAKVI